MSAAQITYVDLKEGTTNLPANNETEELNCAATFDKAESSLLLLVGIIFNCIAVAVLIRVRRRTQARISALTILLASNDLFACSILMTSTIINTATCDRLKSSPLCLTLGFVAMSSFSWSLNIVVLLSVDRYIMVKHPFFHFNRHKSKVILIIICLVGLMVDLTLVGLPLLGVGLPYQYYNHNRFCAMSIKTKGGGLSQRMLMGSFATNTISRAVIVAYLNIAVSFVMRKRSTENVGTWNETQTKTMETALAFSRLTQIIALTNVILTVPFSIKLLVDSVLGNKDSLENIEDKVTSVLLYITPLVNPVLYVASNGTYRRCLWEMVTCKNSNVSSICNSAASRRASDCVLSYRRPSEPTLSLNISKSKSELTLENTPNNSFDENKF